MPSRTECYPVEFGSNTIVLDVPLKKYIVDFGEYTDIVEASNMTTTDLGVVFEHVVIRGKDGVRLGMGRTFIEHTSLVGVTLVEEEFGGIKIDNNTKLGLFTVMIDDG